jgi:PAS domain S-box-containing protein
MIELINNTLHIIAKVSNSNCAYLLRMNNWDAEIITIYGDERDKYTLFNHSLIDLHNSGIVDSESVKKLNAFKLLNRDESISSFLIQDIFSIKERNESIYLVMLSGKAGQYNQEIMDNILSIVNILSFQVKQFLELKRYQRVSIKSEPKFDAEYENVVDLMSDWEKSFNSLMEISSDLIFILNKDGNFILINEFGLNQLEYSLPELKGKHFTQFVEPELLNQTVKSLNEILSTNETKRFETTFLSKYDRPLKLEISGKTVLKGGKIIGMIASAHNITKEKNYEDELKKIRPKLSETERLIHIERKRTKEHKSLIEELNRLKSEFISNLSHEFRTPLASIIGFSETIESDPDLLPEMKKEFNHVILNEGKRLAKLINEVLDTTSIEEGTVPLVRTEFDIVSLLQTIIDTQNGFAVEKSLEVIYEKPDEEVLIEADRERLREMFEALINNAIKFNNDHGRVRVTVSNLYRELEVIVSDTGIGIPEKDLPYVFQKFYRISRPGTEIPSTGVGLVFVKQIVDLHKGMITVQSEPGSGSSFIVRLPKFSKIEKSEVET